MSEYKVWEWQNLDTWIQEIWDLMSDILTDAVKADFLLRPPEYLVSDDLSWLDEIVLRVSGKTIDSRTVLSDRLQEHYHAIRAFHGARVTDVSTYKKEGLLPLNAEQFEAKAREIFVSDRFPEVTNEMVQVGIDIVGRDTREGRVYFDTSEEHLIRFCSHYMVYGSEFLTAIAANIPGPRNYRSYFKQIGTPTLFACDVPFIMIRGSTKNEFAGIALEAMFSSLTDEGYRHPPVGRGGGFWISAPLPPEYIVSQRHLQELRDPFPHT